MKMMSNKKLRFLLIGILASQAISPALAQEPSFCTTLDSTATIINQKINTRDSELVSALNDRRAQINDSRVEADQRIAAVRAVWDANNDSRFAVLESQANTSARKTAVANFKIAVLSAVVQWRAAISDAVKDFRDVVNQYLNDSEAAVNSARAAFKISVLDALDRARNSCNSQADPEATRATLINNLRAAQNKLQADIIAIEGMRSVLTPALNARRSAFQAARTAFQTNINKARTDLKQIFRL